MRLWGPRDLGGSGGPHQRATLICTEQSECKWSEAEEGLWDIQQKTEEKREHDLRVGAGGMGGKEMEVIGEQCFILKVKVTERRRSCGSHSEYKVDWRPERIHVVQCDRSLLLLRGFSVNFLWRKKWKSAKLQYKWRTVLRPLLSGDFLTLAREPTSLCYADPVTVHYLVTSFLQKCVPIFQILAAALFFNSRLLWVENHPRSLRCEPGTKPNHC